jgi:two-component system phosphate regulon sensor histidine kinase PhoR
MMKNYMLIARDITQIIKLLQSRQIFLSNLNHELRTPLTVLQGYLEMLENRKASKALHSKAVSIMQGTGATDAEFVAAVNIFDQN